MTDTERLRDALDAMIDVVDRMAHQPPDKSQADYELWEDLWDASKEGQKVLNETGGIDHQRR